ncbi:MAG: Dabb family protein [Verrucomicrobiota bacterium]
MLVHTVLFWLKKDLQGDQITQFRLALETMKGIKHAEAVYIGSPANTPDRPVIDKSYDFCLTVILKNIAAHDAYQIDPIHIDFLKNQELWRKVKVYDAD